MDKTLKIGEFTLLRKAGILWLLHPSLRDPVELNENLLVLLFKRTMREAVGL